MFIFKIGAERFVLPSLFGAGLPDGNFSNQNSKFWYILRVFAMKILNWYDDIFCSLLKVQKNIFA
jgi:hypothetical protein